VWWWNSLVPTIRPMSHCSWPRRMVARRADGA
jgi:hypothetical protein